MRKSRINHSKLFAEGRNHINIPMGDIFKAAIPFLLLQIVALSVCMLAPQVILWLPRLVYG